MPGDLPQDVHRNTRISHPGEAGVPQIVPTEVLITKPGHHVIPVCCVTQHRGTDPAAARAGEEPGIWVRVDDVQAAGDQLAPFFDDWHLPGPLAFGGFVDQPTWAAGGLAADCPDPGARVDIRPADAGYLTNTGSCAGREGDDVTPAWEVVRRTRDQRGGKPGQCVPVGQGQGTRVIEFIFGALDSLCSEYPFAPADQLLIEGRAWLRRITTFQGQQLTLKQHREILVQAGWVTLLLACIEYDTGNRQAAETTRQDALSLRTEADHAEVQGWAQEIRAWMNLTAGDYHGVITAAEAGTDMAPVHGVTVQLAAQGAKPGAGSVTGGRPRSR